MTFHRRLSNTDVAIGAVIAAATTALLSLCVWPGLMSFDSLFAYRQSIEGVQSAVWPPMYDYLFYVFRHFPGGPGSLLAAQCFSLFFFAGFIASFSIESRAGRAIAMLAAVAAFFIFPAMLGTVIVLWKDVAVAVFSLAAIVAWLSGLGSFSWLKFGSIFLSLFVAVASRYNALPLLLPFMALVLVDPAGAASDTRKRICALLGAAIVIGASYATILWRLPDFKRLPPVAGMVATIELWDIAGVSACEGKNLVPEGVEGASRIPDSDFPLLYDRRHTNLTLENPLWKERVSARQPADPDAVNERWKTLILEHTGCYIDVRNAVFREQFGLHAGPVYYPTHGGIDENPYGIHLAFPDRASALIQKIVAWGNHPLRRAYVLHGLAIALATLAIARNRWRYDLVFALAAGVVGFVALLYIVAPAADARYVFPSSVFSALLIILSVARLVRSFSSTAPQAQLAGAVPLSTDAPWFSR